MNFQYLDRDNRPITGQNEFLTYQIHVDNPVDFYGIRGPSSTIVQVVAKLSESLQNDLETMMTVRGKLKIYANYTDFVVQQAVLESFSMETSDFRNDQLLCNITWKSFTCEPSMYFHPIPERVARFWRLKPVKEAIEEVNWMKEGF